MLISLGPKQISRSNFSDFLAPTTAGVATRRGRPLRGADLACWINEPYSRRKLTGTAESLVEKVRHLARLASPRLGETR